MFYTWYSPTVVKYFEANTACLPLQYNTASTNINSYFTSLYAYFNTTLKPFKQIPNRIVNARDLYLPSKTL